MNVSRFDEFCQAVASPFGRRQALKLVAAGFVAALWPKRAEAQLLTCGAVTFGANASNPAGCVAGVPLPGVCAALQATALTGILCPAACPITVSSSSCVCSGTMATFTANTICSCPPGTVTCPTTCPVSGCANCGACLDACPPGRCCINGLCVLSSGGNCTVC
jgi:hypothetical protein